MEQKKHILIIEDEKTIVDTIQYALKKEGFSTRWCATGQAGLEALENESTRLIILDIGLPDTNGFDLLKKIRAITTVPVIFLTARAEEIDRVLGLELGADDYMAKPFSPRELVARIKAVLRRFKETDGRPPSGAKSKTPFTYDEKKKTICYYNRILKLSRYEYLILLTLIKHPGWVFSREQLMEMVWDEPEMSLLRTLDTHIKNIRHKLKTIAPQVDPIVTHHSIGYSLAEDLGPNP